MNYEKQCTIELTIFTLYVLRHFWAYIIVTLIASYAGAKALEKHYFEK